MFVNILFCWFIFLFAFATTNIVTNFTSFWLLNVYWIADVSLWLEALSNKFLEHFLFLVGQRV